MAKRSARGVESTRHPTIPSRARGFPIQGFRHAGRNFYVWDDDRREAASWAAELRRAERAAPHRGEDSEWRSPSTSPA